MSDTLATIILFYPRSSQCCNSRNYLDFWTLAWVKVGISTHTDFWVSWRGHHYGLPPPPPLAVSHAWRCLLVWLRLSPPAATSCSSHSTRPCATTCTSRTCRATATAWSSRTWRASSSPATGCSTPSPSTSPATWTAATTTRSFSCVAPWPPTGSPAAPLESSAPSGLRGRIAVREWFYFCRLFSELESTAWPVASLCLGLATGLHLNL